MDSDKRSGLDAKPVVEVTLEFSDGSGERKVWTWGEVQAGNAPALDNLGQLQDWMVDPRKAWAHPQDPICYSTKVADGHDEDARAWLASL